MNTNIEVSIILPVYNGMPLLQKACESILNQSFKNFELIIVNDGSTDNSHDYIISIKDERIVYIKQENKKLPGALNAGLKQCKGKYITWTSHDNFYNENAIQKMFDALENNKFADFVYSSHTIQYENNKTKLIRAQVRRPIDFILSFPGICCFMWTKKISDKIGLFDEELFGIEDLDYHIRILEINNNFLVIRDNLYTYTQNSKTLTYKLEKNNKYYELEKKLAQKMLLRHNGTHLDVRKLYPYINDCKNRKRALCISNYDLAISILKCKKKAFKEIFSENIYKYFELSFNYDNTFKASLINLIICMKKKNLNFDKYESEIKNLENIHLEDIHLEDIHLEDIHLENIIKKNNYYLKKNLII